VTILIWTGVGLFKHWDEDPSPEDNAMVRTIRKRIAMTDEYDGSKIFTRQNGKRIATPMFLVMIAIASTDLFVCTGFNSGDFRCNSRAILSLRS